MSEIVDDEVNKWENETIDDIWEKWTCKINKISNFASSMFIDKALLIELQYIRTSKHNCKKKFEKSSTTIFELKTTWNFIIILFLIILKTNLKLKTS